MLGANNQFTDDVKDVFYSVIKDMEHDLKILENKLCKHIK